MYFCGKALGSIPCVTDKSLWVSILKLLLSILHSTLSRNNPITFSMDGSEGIVTYG